ncbi:MAG: uroporphyrinogen-III synthase [Polyangiaceae bacterium]
MSDPDFGGLSVVAFESRRAPEMASLIERHNGVPLSAPALREVRSPPRPDTLTFAEQLRDGAFDHVLLLTGVGTRALADEIASVLPREDLVRVLTATSVIARGPKPAAVLRELGVPRFLSVPSPNTYREILTTLDATFGPGGLEGKRMAVQEYGVPNEILYEGLRARGVHITPVQVYTWALPENTSQLRAALGALARNEARIALFTTRAQVENIFLIAAEEGIEPAVRDALARGVVASIGPVCSDALRAEHLPPDIEPEHPKMGHLVKEAAARSLAVLAAKGAPAGAPEAS